MKYLRYLKINLNTFLEYRSNLFFGFIIKVASVGAFAYLWSSIASNGSDLNGYTLSGIVIYYILIQVLDGLYTSEVATFLRDEVMSGNLSGKLIIPANTLLLLFMRHLAKVLAETIMYIVLVLPVIVFWPAIIDSLVLTPSNLVIFSVFFIISSFIGFNFFLSAGMFAFWLKDASAVQMIFKNSIKFLAGVLIPLSILPTGIYNVIMLLPFPYMLYFPVDTLLGNTDSSSFGKALAVSIFWLFILTFLNLVLWKKGLRNYEAVGQ